MENAVFFKNIYCFFLSECVCVSEMRAKIRSVRGIQYQHTQLGSTYYLISLQLFNHYPLVVSNEPFNPYISTHTHWKHGIYTVTGLLNPLFFLTANRPSFNDGTANTKGCNSTFVCVPCCTACPLFPSTPTCTISPLSPILMTALFGPLTIGVLDNLLVLAWFWHCVGHHFLAIWPSRGQKF